MKKSKTNKKLGTLFTIAFRLPEITPEQGNALFLKGVKRGDIYIALADALKTDVAVLYPKLIGRFLSDEVPTQFDSLDRIEISKDGIMAIDAMPLGMPAGHENGSPPAGKQLMSIKSTGIRKFFKDMPARVFTALEKEGYKRVFHIDKLTVDELSTIKGVSRASAEAMKQQLEILHVDDTELTLA